jgi:hypothetical protein
MGYQYLCRTDLLAYEAGTGIPAREFAGIQQQPEKRVTLTAVVSLEPP